MSTAVKLPGMVPIKNVPNWECRHCGHLWPIKNVNEPPAQCPNRECRHADWHRAPIKEGRPRTKRPAKKRKK